MCTFGCVRMPMVWTSTFNRIISHGSISYFGYHIESIYCKICMIWKFFFAIILIFHTAIVLQRSTFVLANNEVSFNIIKQISRVEYTLFSQKKAMKKNYVLNFKLFLSMELLTSTSQPISKFSFDGWFCKYVQICSNMLIMLWKQITSKF